ncbi:hypothetical protein FRX31_032480 [Thalictrum thalictroides]|uniref:60S acidic ribosomal protein P3 n=1 Tax=Thalictrum thalictroides TaxID=46969 RepID=A0A7J6V0K3_THATH|nr:hypothetical protein FRX31_032480 [Thalictrum thalictroides]
MAVYTFRKLVQAVRSRNSGIVSSAFNFVTPSSAVFEVIVGCDFVGSSTAPASSVSGVVAPSIAPAAEEKKEELEESDDDISYLFTDIFV